EGVDVCLIPIDLKSQLGPCPNERKQGRSRHTRSRQFANPIHILPASEVLEDGSQTSRSAIGTVSLSNESPANPPLVCRSHDQDEPKDLPSHSERPPYLPQPHLDFDDRAMVERAIRRELLDGPFHRNDRVVGHLRSARTSSEPFQSQSDLPASVLRQLPRRCCPLR